MAKHKLIDLVIEAAQSREDAEVPREYIEKALQMISSGEREVPLYSTGLPSLKSVYDLALELMPQH